MLALGFLAACAFGIAAGAVAAAAVLTAGTRRAVTGGRNSWAKGAAGERRTARILAPLTRRGRYAVLHDRLIRRSSAANLDHIVFGPMGAVYIDSKNWGSVRSRVWVGAGGQLLFGTPNARRPKGCRGSGFARGRAVATARWEADQIQRALGCPVQTVVAVHGARVSGGLIRLDGVTIVQASRLRSLLRAMPLAPGWSREKVHETARVADRRFPPAASGVNAADWTGRRSSGGGH
ncbi:nuclease-related domain-containing protein [Streptomyces sp. NPDC053474]|uniref:nuclease-related domain-containing protein n=1 Tax=Streptomyces sp. NPDC053474 TaxID=3365704 RepID=UPI0037D31914